MFVQKMKWILSLGLVFQPALAASSNFMFGTVHYEHPFIVKTNDQGENWTFDDLIEFDKSLIMTDACGEKLCVAAGSMRSNSSQSLSIIQSNDQGNSWTQVDLPVDFEYAYFYSSSCSGDLCMIGGHHSIPNDYIPFVVKTANAGQTWEYIDLSSVVTIGRIQEIHCENEYCVAVGTNSKNPLPGGTLQFQPFMIQTFNGGKTWENIRISKTFAAALFSVDCQNDYCVAVGVEKTAINPNPQTFVMQSNQKRTEWKKMLEQEGGYNHVVCYDEGCVAVGAVAGHPLIGVAQKGRWSSQFNGRTSGMLNTVECQDSQCYAGGYADDANEKRVGLLVSLKDGKWQSEALEPNFTDIYSVKCDTVFCFAGGEYYVGALESSAVLMQTLGDNIWTSVDLPLPDEFTSFTWEFH